MPDPSQTPTHIGPFLRHVRNGLNLTLRQAANVTHVNFTYLGQVERGEKNPSPDWLSAYIKALGVEMAAREADAA
jgi:transcriptional regulator with XRE-family HTH domain